MPVGASRSSTSRKLLCLEAFGTGILQWMAALSDRPGMLTPAVRDFIALRTSAGGSYRLLSPPQAIRVQCPDAAVFTVDLHFETDAVFPQYPVAIARAQIEGRTLALNIFYRCYGYDNHVNNQKQLSFTTAAGCVNLIPVMTHELGHAFGLRHADVPSQPALMDSVFSRTALTPTDADVRGLVEALGRSIAGASPGVLEFAASGGVRPPID